MNLSESAVQIAELVEEKPIVVKKAKKPAAAKAKAAKVVKAAAKKAKAKRQAEPPNPVEWKGLPTVSVGDRVVYTGKGASITGKKAAWLKSGAVLKAAGGRWYNYHSHPLLMVVAPNGKKFHLAPANVKVG